MDYQFGTAKNHVLVSGDTNRWHLQTIGQPPGLAATTVAELIEREPSPSPNEVELCCALYNAKVVLIQAGVAVRREHYSDEAIAALCDAAMRYSRAYDTLALARGEGLPSEWD